MVTTQSGKMEILKEALKEIFLHVHTTDSTKIHNELHLLATRAAVERPHKSSTSGALLLEELKLFGIISSKPAHSQINNVGLVYYLKFIAREHGLPPSFYPDIHAALITYPNATFQISETPEPAPLPSCSDIGLLMTKLQIAQTLKYSVARDPNFVTFSQCLEIIGSTTAFAFPDFHEARHHRDKQMPPQQQQQIVSESEENRGQLINQILAQVVQCIVIKLGVGSSAATDDVADGQNDRETILNVSCRLREFLPIFDGTTRRDILKALEAASNSGCRVKVDDVEEFFDQLDLPPGSEKRSNVDANGIMRSMGDAGGIFSFGASVLSQSTSIRDKGEMVQGDVVKTQQVVSSAYKQNISEKTEIQSISLSNALNGNRSQGKERSTETEINPARAALQGSDRGWWTSTWGDIQVLLKMAQAGETIKNADIEWMANRCGEGFNPMNMLMGPESILAIAEIFALICKNDQELHSDIQDSLLKSFFVPKLDPSYNKAREKLLHAFESHSNRVKGKISTFMSSTLLEFKRRSDCTLEMKRIVWRVFSKDDDNLYESFPSALEQVVNFRKSRDKFLVLEQPLDYIGNQVAIWERCKGLEDRFKFINQLLPVLENADDHYTLQVTAGVASIVDSFMSHNLSSMYNMTVYSAWLDLLVALYNKSNSNHHTTLTSKEEDERNKFEASLIRAILNILDKATTTTPADDIGTIFLPKTSKEVLTLLVKLGTKNEDRRLEVLIVVTLANLIIHGWVQNKDGGDEDLGLIKILNKLAYKLSRTDAIDPKASVYLQEEEMLNLSTNKRGNDEEDEDENSLELTHISAYVAKIILYALQNCEAPVTTPEIFEPTSLHHLVQALQTSPDKATRILCAECLFEGVVTLGQSLGDGILGLVRPLTLDPVVDVQVHSTCVYCKSLERLCLGFEGSESGTTKFQISHEDMDALPKLFVYDQVLMLGEKDFSPYINPPILKILMDQAPLMAYSEEIFQLLTFVLGSSDLDSKPILKIIEQQLTSPSIKCRVQLLPAYCFEAIQEIFLSQADLYEYSGRILIAAARTSVNFLSLEVVSEHAHKVIVSCGDKFSTDFEVSFILLHLAQNRHDLPERIFQDFDLALISIRLLQYWTIFDGRFGDQVVEPGLIEFLDHLESQGDQLIGKRSVGQSCGPVDRIDDDFKNETLIGTLEWVRRYQDQNCRLQPLHFYVMEKMLLAPALKFNIQSETGGGAKPISNQVIQCLIRAAENGQSLPTELIRICFDYFNVHAAKDTTTADVATKNTNLSVLTLALALVGNSQSLPDTFVSFIVDLFCTIADTGINLGVVDKETSEILLIISKLAQSGQSTIPAVGRVSRSLCSLWENSKNVQKEVQVVNAFTKKMAGSFLSKAKQFRNLCKASRHRLEVLVALNGIGSSETAHVEPQDIDPEEDHYDDDTVDMWTVHSVFVEAFSDQNPQISETGLRGLISINWHDAPYCSNEELESLFTFECNPNSSPTMKADIHGFFSHNRDFLPVDLRLRIGLLDDIINSNNDESLLSKLEFFVQNESFSTTPNPNDGGGEGVESNFSKTSTFIESPACQQKLEAILFQKHGQSLNLVARALVIIDGYPSRRNFSSSIFDAVAFTMVNHREDAHPSYRRVQKFCRDILMGVVEDKISVSDTLINYLLTDKVNCVDILDRIHKDGCYTKQLSTELKSTLEMNALHKILNSHTTQKAGQNPSSGAGVKGQGLSEEFVAEIMKLDLNSLDQTLDQEMVTKCLSLNVNVLKSIPQLTNLLAASIAQLDDIFALPGKVTDTMAAILETVIVSQEPGMVHVSVVRAYQKIIADGFAKVLEKCLLALTKIFRFYVHKMDPVSVDEGEPESPSGKIMSRHHHQNPLEMHVAIFEVILQAIECADAIPVAFIPFNTFKIMADQLQHPNPIYRHRAFKIIRRIKATDILFVQEDVAEQADELAKLVIPDIKFLMISVFKEIYGAAEGPKAVDMAKEQILKDHKFAVEFVEFLYSLTFWDLKSLAKVKEDRTKWRQLLVISDFISCFAHSENEKLNIKIELGKMYHRLADEVKAEKIVYSLTSCLYDFRGIDSFPVERTLFLINQLSFDEAIVILTQAPSPSAFNGTDATETSKGRAFEVYTQLEETVLAQSFGSKFSFSIGSEILKVITKKLVEAVGGVDIVWSIYEVISKIQEPSSLDDLVKFLNENKTILEQNGCLSNLCSNGGLVARKLSVSDLKVYLEAQILLRLLPEKVRQRRGERLERIFMQLLTQGITVKQLQNFYELAEKRQPVEFVKIFEHITFQVSQYKVSSEVFNQIVASLKAPNAAWSRTSCINSCNSIINRLLFGVTRGTVKGVDRIISEFRAKNPDARFSISCFNSESQLSREAGKTTKTIENVEARWNELEKLLRKISKGQVSSPIMPDSTPICEWTVADIGTWAKIKAAAAEATAAPPSKKIDTEDDVLKTESMTDGAFLTEALMVAKRAFHLTTNFDMTNVQLLACLLALNPANNNSSLQEEGVIRGLLQQVATGSGKSAIIATIAVIKCIVQGVTVDVYTSNSILAERDAKEWSKFYGLFHLTCDHNGDKGGSYISGEKVCYRNHVVYGDGAQFQFDYLRHSYSDLGTLGERKLVFAIIDEVDTMFIDDSSKLARLSSSLPGMDLLQILYHFIWDRLSFINSHLFRLFDQVYYLEGQLSFNDRQGIVAYSFADRSEAGELKVIDNLAAYVIGGGSLETARIYPVQDVEDFVTSHLQKYASDLISEEKGEEEQDDEDEEAKRIAKAKVKLPKHLKGFVKSQIPKWIDSALTAIAFQENREYVVDGGSVKPVDYRTTGVVQSSTNWNNGLHQFLQIKHGLKMGSESVTTNFLSNLAMIEMYEGLVGFTGTLGSARSRKLLREVYKVDLMTLPETYFKRYFPFPDIVVSSEREWLEEILITTLEEAEKQRGVLIICETIRQADMIIEALNRFKAVKVKVYTKNIENQEKQVERIHAGDVIVATNLAGRGTDIKTTDIEKSGGLHVCLTFLPASLRVDEQAFGRTSRQGNGGTSQLIIMDTDTGSTSSNTPSSSYLTQNSSEKLIQQRDVIENKVLDDFQHQQLDGIRVKGNLFRRFSSLLQKVRHHVRNKEKTWLGITKDCVEDTLTVKVFGQHVPTFLENITVQAVEERWSMFLRKVDDGRIPTDEADAQFDLFQEKIETVLETDSIIEEANNCFYFIQLGNYEYSQDRKYRKTLEKAIEYYKRACALDPNFSVAALVGQAYIGLKGRENVVASNSHEDGYKTTAIKLLKKTILLLHQEMAMLTVMQVLVKKNHVRKFEKNPVHHDPDERYQDDGLTENLLFQQLTEKSNILGSYLKNVEGTMLLVQKSLRRVFCTGIKKTEDKREVRTTRVIGNHTILKGANRKVPWEQFTSYHLAFHDLTVSRDLTGDNDQAINTLSEEKLKKFQNIISNFSWKSFKVTIQCPQADFGSILLAASASPASDILEHNCRLNLELCGLQLDLKSGKLIIDLESVQHLIFDSYSIQIGGDPLKLASLVTSNAIPIPISGDSGKEAQAGVTIEIHAFKSENLIQRYYEEVLSSHSQQLRHQQMTEFLKIYKNDTCTVKIGGLKGLKVIEQILRAVKLIGLDPSSITLTLNELVTKDIASVKTTWLSTIQDHVTSCTVSFSKIDNEKGAKSIIRSLRQLSINFVLRIEDLSLQAAHSVLQNASLQQENISQVKWQELVNLYTAHRLPFMELRELSARGISLLVKFNENGFVPWISVACLVSLAAVQAVAGGLLICTAFGASWGVGLLTEGMSDLFAAQQAYSAADFSWSDYRTQKAVSVVISLSTMGLSSLKAGAKGATMLARTTGAEIVEQAGKRVVVKGKILNETIKGVGKSLKSLAAKSVFVSSAETGAKMGLKCLGDGVADFCFEQLRDHIEREVSIRAKVKFGEDRFKQILSYYNALDKCAAISGTAAVQASQNQLSARVLKIVQGTTNPKATRWLQAWASVGGPLVTRILSSSQFLGSTLSRMTTAYGIVSGMTEIRGVIDRVFVEVLIHLEDQKPDMVTVIQKYCGFSRDSAQQIHDHMTFRKTGITTTTDLGGFDPHDFYVDKFADENDKNIFTSPTVSKNLVEIFKKLHKSQQTFKPDDLTQLTKSMIDLITSHIIQVANSHLVSPVMSCAVGSVLAKISIDLQNRFAVHDHEKVVQETDNLVKKIEELKMMEVKTEEDTNFLKAHSHEIEHSPNVVTKETVSSGGGHLDTFTRLVDQIKNNSHYLTLAWEKRELMVQAFNVSKQFFSTTTPLPVDTNDENGTTPAPSTSSQNNQGSKTFQEQVQAVLTTEPADPSTMITMGVGNKLNLKIIDVTTNYKPTKEDCERGIQIILYKKLGLPSSDEKMNHDQFLLLDPLSGQIVDIAGTESVDCGYIIVGHLTGKSVDQLRIQVAKFIVNDPTTFQEIRGASSWISDREPVEANSLLRTGGDLSVDRNVDTSSGNFDRDKISHDDGEKVTRIFRECRPENVQREAVKIVQKKLTQFILFQMDVGACKAMFFDEGRGLKNYLPQMQQPADAGVRAGNENAGTGHTSTSVSQAVGSLSAVAAKSGRRQVRQRVTGPDFPFGGK